MLMFESNRQMKRRTAIAKSVLPQRARTGAARQAAMKTRKGRIMQVIREELREAP
jgi:hypothetical protein